MTLALVAALAGGATAAAAAAHDLHFDGPGSSLHFGMVGSITEVHAGYRLEIRLDDGRSLTVHQADHFHPGDRVRIIPSEKGPRAEYE